jgi:hypothetical protein
MADQVKVLYIRKIDPAPVGGAWQAEIESGPFANDRRVVNAATFAAILTTLGTTYTTLAAEVNT